MSDKALKASINALVEPRRSDQEALPPAKPRPAIPAGLGVGRVIRKPGTPEAGAGIASPLTEPDYSTRTWHAPVSVTSTDGIWVIQFEHVATVDMTDANDQSVQLIFDEPS